MEFGDNIHKKKLLVLFPSEGRGGAENYALTIASAAVSQGRRVFAAFPEREGTASLVRDFSSRSVKYYPLEIAEKGDQRGQRVQAHSLRRKRTLHLLDELKPDAVLLVLPSIQYCMGSMLACAARRIPAVVTFEYVQREYRFDEWRLKAYHWARSRMQNWVAVSRENRGLIARSFKIPEEEVSVIYNGASFGERVSPEDKSLLRDKIRRELGLNNDCKLLLTVAALRKQKGHEYLVPAIPNILKDFPDAKWLFVGDGDQRENLTAQVRGLGIGHAVFFLGRRDDVPDILNASDLFVFPTRFEGHPFALMEAIAAGLPVVTTDASGITEIVEHMKHGLVCRKEDTCDLMESILYALRHSDEMLEMSQEAWKFTQQFSEERMVKQTLDIFECFEKVTSQ